MDTLEESVASWGRAVLIEIIATLEILTERTDDDTFIASAMPEIQELYKLVSPENADEFLSRCKALRKRFPKDFLAKHAYLSHSLKQALKHFSKSDELEGYYEAYASSLALDLTPWALKPQEIARGRENTLNFEEFTQTLYATYLAYEPKSELQENLGGISLKKLEKQIFTAELTMSELRLLCLVLGVIVSYEVINDNEESSPPSVIVNYEANGDSSPVV